MKFSIYGNDECEIILQGDLKRTYRIDFSAYEVNQYYMGCLELSLGVRPGLLIHCIYDGEWSFAVAAGGFKKFPRNVHFHTTWHDNDPASQTLHIDCPKSASFYRGDGLKLLADRMELV